MWRWAGSSNRATPGLAAAAVLAAVAVHAQAKVFLSADEAVRLAFPGATVERRVAFLTQAQLTRARELAGGPIDSAMTTYFVATQDGRPAGVAYVDTHRVRTLPETLLVVLDPRGAVRRVEVLSFAEPEEYLPKSNWYRQFDGRALSADVSLKGVIRPVTGATLTARATTEAVRRVLAIHRVIHEGAR